MAGETIDFLLLGGGLASVTAAETLRAEGAEGSIAILSADAALPYQRPPLSKQYLTRDQPADRILIQPEQFYRDQRIALRLGTRAAAVEPANHVVVTDGGERISYRKLLIATGGRANTLAVPGADLAGIHCLRTQSDADAIRRDRANAKRALVVGGSFVGLEVAAALAGMGLAVTIVDRGHAIMRRFYAPALSDFFARYASDAGVEIVLGESIAAFEGKGRVRAAVGVSGRRWSCDMVVLGIGIRPETDFLASSGLGIDDGVVVDDRLRAGDPDIFAAGDVANFYDRVFARRRRIEHWDHAVKQGKLAARNMLGQNLFTEDVSYFFGDVFDLSFSMIGAPDEGEEYIERGTLAARSFGLFYLRNDMPRALFSLGRPPGETRAAEGLIRHRVNVSAIKEKLASEDFALDRIPTQTVLILQGGGALGAFECGVVRALEEAEIFPDLVAGVSIGAFNGAIIASNPKNATAALQSFWGELAVATPDFFNRDMNRMAGAMQILTLGVPRFFKPRWFGFDMTSLLTGWTSLYDTAPIRDLIARYVDFPGLKSSPVRLLVSAVNVETAELSIFDSYVDDLTPDHILASGSLPPGFPWTTVDGKRYWDGGIISNSPLEMVIERCGPAGKRVFAVDLFAGRKSLPVNLLEVMARRDEIVYAERMRNDVRTRELVEDFRKLVTEIVGWLDDESARKVKERPNYIQLVGSAAPMSVTQIVRAGEVGEPSSRDYDFSRAAIDRNDDEGYRLTRQVLGLEPE
jgi:NADPH-dependent 2,4-dienoyl-CoA reductase/sulfur reductase-like enzyme/predicted acylesterase/phospholipase RssA